MKPFDEPIFVTRPMLPPLNEFNNELKEIWASKQLTNNGMKLQLLESEILKVLKVQNISVFNNGTIALMMAVSSLRILGEVITTPFTFPATPHVLFWNGITPVFCDIDDDTMTIDPIRIERLITPRTTAIMGVHVYGIPCHVQPIQDIADRYGLKVIYDAAHAFMTEIDGVGIGTFGDVSMFSFHATKLFHTAEGGALTCNDPNLKLRIDYLRNFGIKNEEEVAMLGLNGKMNELQAAMGLVNLKYLEAERGKRKSVVDTYNRLLSDIKGIKIFQFPDNIKNSYQYYVIRINPSQFGISRDELHTHLKKYNVYSRKYFYPLCNEYACYKNLPSSDPNNLPIAGKIAKEVLCLPLYGGLDIPSAEKICEIIRESKSN
jgi:dTDP-4-amino-4,6-dideoxygalactose transaminase